MPSPVTDGPEFQQQDREDQNGPVPEVETVADSAEQNGGPGREDRRVEHSSRPSDQNENCATGAIAR
jgi:hypothetical protein